MADSGCWRQPTFYLSAFAENRGIPAIRRVSIPPSTTAEVETSERGEPLLSRRPKNAPPANSARRAVGRERAETFESA